MKRMIAWILAMLMLVSAGVAFGAAQAVNVMGTVTVQTGTAAPRPVREGDVLNAKDTVFTGAASAVTLRFDDGQIASLTRNSKLSIDAYDYNAANKSGNVFLNLFTGGMRAVTGLIGRNSPQSVGYRAATATIGIRGTDITTATDGEDTVIFVTEGVIEVRFGDKTVTVAAGEAILIHKNSTFQTGTADQIREIIRNLAFGPMVTSLLPTNPNGTPTAVSGTSYTSGSNGPAGGGGGGTASGQ